MDGVFFELPMFSGNPSLVRHKAIIVDLDGTLCDGSHRDHLFNASPKDWDELNRRAAFDTPHHWCMEIVELFGKSGYKIFFITARSGTPECKQITNDWLVRNVGYNVDWELIMRPANDDRDDCLVKKDLYNMYVRDIYEVLFCIDDRADVAYMWRELGLTCLQCR